MTLYGAMNYGSAPIITQLVPTLGTYSAQTVNPPKSLINKIKKKRPDWEGFVK